MVWLKCMRAFGCPKAVLAAAILTAASGLAVPHTATAGPVYNLKASGVVLSSFDPQVNENDPWSLDLRFEDNSTDTNGSPEVSTQNMDCISCVMSVGAYSSDISSLRIYVDTRGFDVVQLTVGFASPLAGASSSIVTLFGIGPILESDDWVAAVSIPLASSGPIREGIWSALDMILAGAGGGLEGDGLGRAISLTREITAVPEPGTLALMGLGLLGLVGAAGLRSRRRGGRDQYLAGGQPA